ncbi:GNAT family N-acetyltransferase [Stutzerimonas tarimensis]|uniref:GNAT family N-acetyltransferase n=1 Tax=Stutzerimonas tarimensis TaxID=1507735 RepID=A0ABV7T7I7_9GAMM
MRIRDAQEGDLPGILAIYNEAVLSSTAVTNEHTVDLENRRDWLHGLWAQDFPVLVAVSDEDQVLAYASYGPWRPFDGFRFTVEHRVYVREDQRGGGIGRAITHELIERARMAGKHALIGAIESENRASVHMHQQLGFLHVGQLRQVGRKFDRWLDITLMQLTIAPRDPAAPTSMPTEQQP